MCFLGRYVEIKKEGEIVTEEEIDVKEAEIRGRYPEWFSHPETKDGEVFLQHCIISFVAEQLHLYRQIGLHSVRVGRNITMVPIRCYNLKGGSVATSEVLQPDGLPIFANLREAIPIMDFSKMKE